MSGKTKVKSYWLSLGWLTDKDLAGRVIGTQLEMSVRAGCKVSMSEVIKKLLWEGIKHA